MLFNVTANYIPFLYGMHSVELSDSLSPSLRDSLTAKKKLDGSVTLVINLADFIASCARVNMYRCCLPEYSADVFNGSMYFLDGLLVSREFNKEHYATFKRILRLFGVDTALLYFWLRSCCCSSVEILPTVPVALYKYMQSGEYIEFTTVAQDINAEHLTEAVGGIQREFRYAGNIPLLDSLGVPENMEPQTRYMYSLLHSLYRDDYHIFPLCYVPREVV